jgi:hypothetical protein
MVEVWDGDLFIDTMTYTEYCYMKEANVRLSFIWCQGYGP